MDAHEMKKEKKNMTVISVEGPFRDPQPHLH